jgi:hypothetical protein
MLTDSYKLARAQQKKLKNQAKIGSWLALMLWKGSFTWLKHRMARFTGSFIALRQEDSSFKGETTMPKAQDYRWMGPY